jgi:mono/diheme cytochrome c family protein
MLSHSRRLAGLAAVATTGAALAAGPTTARAQDTTAARTTASGVYTAAQAARGKEVYDLACLSCHKPVELSNPKFLGTIVGKPVADFFVYLRSQMPQDNPASLSDDDYATVIAYVLQLNAMPPGETALPADSASLTKIRVTAPAPSASTRKGTRR